MSSTERDLCFEKKSGSDVAAARTANQQMAAFKSGGGTGSTGLADVAAAPLQSEHEPSDEQSEEQSLRPSKDNTATSSSSSSWMYPL